jgi:hypothetical protein
MTKIKSAVKSIMMTKWFIKTSWQYINTNRVSSKVEFFVGVVPAWARFVAATYKDCRLAP